MTAISKIVSGGQTGVDRAALDVAIEAGISHGGWCPKGRLAEDGRLPDRYHLQETPQSDYIQRTEWNVRDSDGTLILYWDRLEGGTKLTVDFCKKYSKPFFLVDMNDPLVSSPFHQWMITSKINVLNIAGPRASKGIKVYSEANNFLTNLLQF